MTGKSQLNCGSFPDLHNKASHNLVAGGGYCLQCVKMQHMWSALKGSTTKLVMPVLRFTLS